MKNNENCTTEEFINDVHFIQWVLQPHEQVNTFWGNYMLKYPHKKEILENAKVFIIHLHSHFTNENQKSISEQEIKAAWDKLNRDLTHRNKSK
jgi:hypothetical protein